MPRGPGDVKTIGIKCTIPDDGGRTVADAGEELACFSVRPAATLLRPRAGMTPAGGGGGGGEVGLGEEAIQSAAAFFPPLFFIFS
jgi:hypothetical protein